MPTSTQYIKGIHIHSYKQYKHVSIYTNTPLHTLICIYIYIFTIIVLEYCILILNDNDNNNNDDNNRK